MSGTRAIHQQKAIATVQRQMISLVSDYSACASQGMRVATGYRSLTSQYRVRTKTKSGFYSFRDLEIK